MSVVQQLQNDGDGMTNMEILKMAKRLRLPHFKYFMSNELNSRTPIVKACGVLNLDDSTGPGAHHVMSCPAEDNMVFVF